MTSYNTGNPIGSTAVKDLYDNAENLDTAVNTRQAESWDDRLGVARKTWWGMEQDFQRFLINSGYQNIGDYAAGLEITAHNQIFWRDGELYRASAALELPYTTTGDWANEEGLFVAVGDSVLRQELAGEEGAGLVGFSNDENYPSGTIGASVTRKIISISSLRGTPGRNPGDMAYVVSYYDQGSSGGGLFLWEDGSTKNDDGGINIASVGGVWARQIKDLITPEMFGAIGDGVEDDTIPVEQAFKSATALQVPLVASGSYLVSKIDLNEVPGKLRLTLTGSIKRMDSDTSEPFIEFHDKETLIIEGGGEVDLNFEGQSQWAEGLTIDASGFVRLSDITFRNAKLSHVYFRSSDVHGVVENCKFLEGSPHSGIIGEGCTFLKTRGGHNIKVSGNIFIQSMDPETGQSRNPAGYINIDTGAPKERAESSVFVIENNYFENLGHYAAGNLVSPLDFYSYVGTIHITGNVFRKSRITPIRVSAGNVVIIDGNNILQIDDQIIDGGAPYADAAMISLSLIDRGYPSDKNDISIAVIKNNRMRSMGAINCHGLRATSGSPDYLYRRLSVLDNQLRSFPASSKQGVLISRVRESKISGNSIEGFAQAVRIQQTNIAPLVAGGVALCNISENRFAASGGHIWARDDVGNLHMTVRDNVGVTATSHPFTLRNMSSAIIQGCSFTVSGQGDVNNIGALWLKDNDIGSAQPSGLSTCPYYRVTDNKGMTNASST